MGVGVGAVNSRQQNSRLEGVSLLGTYSRYSFCTTIWWVLILTLVGGYPKYEQCCQYIGLWICRNFFFFGDHSSGFCFALLREAPKTTLSDLGKELRYIRNILRANIL